MSRITVKALHAAVSPFTTVKYRRYPHLDFWPDYNGQNPQDDWQVYTLYVDAHGLLIVHCVPPDFLPE